MLRSEIILCVSTAGLGGRLRLAILVACAGCGAAGDGLPRQPIWGTVKLDGQPLARGFITFTPAAGQTTQSGGIITDGNFSVLRDQGPVAGKYSVSINSASAEANLPPEEVKTGMPGHVPIGRGTRSPTSTTPKRRSPPR